MLWRENNHIVAERDRYSCCGRKTTILWRREIDTHVVAGKQPYCGGERYPYCGVKTTILWRREILILCWENNHIVAERDNHIVARKQPYCGGER